MTYLKSLLKKINLTNYKQVIIILFLIIYIPMGFIFYFTYSRTLSMISKEKIDEYHQFVEKSSSTMEFLLNDSEQAVITSINQPGLKAALQNYDNILEKNDTTKQYFENYLEKNFSKLEKEQPFIKESICIMVKQKKVFTSGNNTIDPEVFLKSTLFANISKADYNTFWEYINSDQIYSDWKDEKIFVVINKIYEKDNITVNSYIINIIDLDKINSLSSGTFAEILGDIRLVDKDTTIIGNSSLIASKDLNSIIFNKRSSTNYFDIELGKRTYNLVYIPINNTPLHMLGIIPKGILIDPTKKALINNFLVMVFFSAILYGLIIIAIIHISSLTIEKQRVHFKLTVSEEINEKLNLYSHDFLNHLQIINGLLELDKPLKAREYLKNVSDLGKTSHSKIQTGISEIDALTLSSMAQAEQNNISVICETIVLKFFSNKIIFDLTQILSNLIKNALYALINYEGEEKKLIIRISEDRFYYKFEIINNHPLISEAMKNKIFEKGFSSKGLNGAGLGLFITQKLALKNKALLELKINTEGNNFSLLFPKENI